MNIAEIIEKLKQPVPPELISQKKIKGKSINYIAWYDLCDLLDKRVGNGQWEWLVLNITTTENRLILTGKLTIIGDDRKLSQSATGTEILNCSNYGDPSSNAEAMALRRTCSKFGLARYLWRKEGLSKPINSYPKTQPKAYRVTDSSKNSRELTKEEFYAKFRT